MATNTTTIMRDYAYLDDRSAHAHIRGTSRRANCYIAMDTLYSAVGQQHKTASHFAKLARMTNKSRKTVARASRFIANLAVASIGLLAGALTYLAIFR